MLAKHAGLDIKWMELDNTTPHSTVQAVKTGATVLAQIQTYQKEKHSEAKYGPRVSTCNLARYSVCRLDTEVKQWVSSEYKGVSLLTCQEL